MKKGTRSGALCDGALDFERVAIKRYDRRERLPPFGEGAAKRRRGSDARLAIVRHSSNGPEGK